MKSLILTALKSGTPTQRDTCIQALEQMYARPEAVEATDYTALLAQMTRETATADLQNDRARRLGRLALAAARKMGTDDMVPDAQAVELASASSKLYGTNATEAVDEVLQHVHRPFLRTFVSDERVIVRAAIGRALARDPDAEDMTVLTKLLDDTDPSVETAVALALGEHKVESARTELLVRARVARSPVRCAALQAIGKLGGPYVLEALIQGLSDRDPTVRLAAAKGLAQLSDPAAAQVLIGQLAQVGDPELFDAARSGLVSMGAAAWPDLVRAVNQPGGNMRREAALILSEQCQPEAASPLLSILTSNAKDTRVATELAVLTCVDARGQIDPAQTWWGWWDGVRHDDAQAWFRAALERVGMSPPPPSAFVESGTAQGRLFLVNVMARTEPWLVERARREYKRLTGKDPGEIPAAGPERDAWIRDLRASASREASRG
jgi:HEAT repeat protein